MEELEKIESTGPRPDRPTGLVVLLVMSGLSGLFSILGGFSLFVLTSGISGQSDEEITNQVTQSLGMFGLASDEQLLENMERIMATGPVMSAIGMLCGAFTIAGVVLMVRYRKLGFHLYTGTKIVETFLPAAIAGAIFFSPLTFMLAVLFIYFYSRFLSIMK